MQPICSSFDKSRGYLEARHTQIRSPSQIKNSDPIQTSPTPHHKGTIKYEHRLISVVIIFLLAEFVC